MSLATLTLNDGVVLPAIGFGTYRLKGGEGADTIARAIITGYRLLDSAFNYENEGTVGAAIRRAGVPRDEVLVASKLPGRHHAYDAALATVEELLFRTGLDHLDLYLIHWPNPRQGLFVEAWQALIEARRRGLVRSIGVCNFLPAHLDRLVEATGVTPAVNQIELHPYFPQDAQRAADRARGIVTQAWSPLGRASTVLHDPVLETIARRLGRSIPQVILRWHVQLGVQPLPKASSPERQADNLDLSGFELTDDDMAAIAGLARPDGRIKDQDPARYEEF
ncbi:aldo/keto reductase [Endobacter medicaginis]